VLTEEQLEKIDFVKELKDNSAFQNLTTKEEISFVLV
jgi:hypothetical protein